ncbi:MAG: Asp/Glu racemase [Acidisphaera sp.]|nr:Asp/Glu racemase [Acidisphaera sp.]
MSRILILNPNSSRACTDGIAAAVAPWQFAGGPQIEVATLEEGPPAIYGWREWHAVVEPLCRFIEQQDADYTPPDAYIIACGSDPGIDPLRALTPRPVFGVFRSAVAAAVSRAERFGVIALVDQSVERHLAALRAMGLERRLAAEVALNVSMETLLDENAARARLIDAGWEAKKAGSQVLVLGCTGMAHHRPFIEESVGVPVIEPCQAAVSLAFTVVVKEQGGALPRTPPNPLRALRATAMPVETVTQLVGSGVR